MVAIVSGNSLGLDLTSLATLGQRLRAGSAGAGRSGEQGFVNVATGNLVLQDRDTYLQSRGDDIAVVRTYNSQGKLNDENADNWGIGAYVQPLTVAGTLNASGSTIARTGRDGSEAIYAYDTTRALYVSTAGSGAYDTIKYDSSSTQFEWTDGDTGVKQTYEGSGQYRLLSAKDPSGNTTTYAYNAAGRLASAASASGETVYYDFTGNNLTQIRVVNSANATSTQVRYGYDASNRLGSVTVDLSPTDNAVSDGKVYQSTYTYDGSSNRIASVTQTDGTTLRFTYVQVGSDYRVASVTDGLNQVTRYSYDTTNRRTTVTDPLGLVSTYEYDTAGQLTKATAPSVGGVSQATVFAYNANGDVSSVTDAEGRVITYGYDANGNQTLQRDQAGNTITRTYDTRNQLLTETSYLVPDPDGAGSAQASSPLTTRYAYDASGRNLLRFVVSAEGRVTENKYDSYGQLTSVVKYPDAVYDASSLAITASLSESTLASWASSQSLSRTQRTDYAYDVRGQVSSATAYGTVDKTGAGVSDATASVTRYTYDQIGQLLQTTSATGGATSYVYDGLGRVISSTDALGVVTLTQYTDASRKTIVTRTNGLVTTQLYDAAGRLVSVAQANAGGTALGETKYYYDADGRLRMTQDPTGVRSWLLYDDAGRKVGEIDGNGSLTEYTYDKNDLLVQRIAYATAVGTSALVDAQGAPVTTVTLAALRPTASDKDRKTVNAYDAANRLSRTATFTGTLASVTETLYDGASRVIGTIQYATGVAASNATAGAISAPTAAAGDRSTRNFYDGDGRLSGTLDAEGYLTTLKYDAAGRLVEKLAYATATSTSLRASGTLAQLLPSTAAGDAKTTNLYNNKGLLAASVDAEKYFTEYVYDANGNLTQTVRYASRVTATVTSSSMVASIRPATSASDQTTTTTYDALGRIASRTSFEGTVTSYAYDSVGNLVSTVSGVSTAEARTLLARYDLQGRLTGELSAEGAAKLTGGQTQAQIDAIWLQYGSTHAYDAAGRRVSTTDAAGSKTLFFYDVDGNLTFTVNALGEVKEQRFDTLGQLSSTIAYGTRISLSALTGGLAGGLVNATLTSAVTAAANAALDSVTSFTYARDGHAASATDALGNITTYGYNAFGDLIARNQSVGDGRTLSEIYSIDRRGLQTASTVDPSGVSAITSAVYDAFGRLSRTISPNGAITDRVYDRLGRVVTTIDPVNASRSTTYDAFGRTLSQTDALGKTTTFAYSNSSRTMTMTTPEGVVTTTTFTRFGQVLSVSDGKGQLTSYQYDRNGNLVKTTTPLTTTASTYDAVNRVTQTTDANGNTTLYTYDAANRMLTRRVDPLGLNLTTSYQYDAKGQRVSVTDAAGVVTQTQFDRKGQVVKQIVDPSGLNLQTVYAYDGRGRTLSVTSPGGTMVQYAYDTLGRRTQERTDPAGLNLTRSWTYDKNGNVVSSTDANGQLTRYAYDANNRPTFTVDPLGDLTQVAYDAEGRIVKTTRYATPINLSGLAAAPSIADIQSRIVAQSGQDMVEHRVYDKDGRLAATVDATGAVVRYTYDANGNVVERRAYASRIDMANWTPGTLPAPAADAAHDQRMLTVYDALNRAIYSVDGVGAVVAQSYDGNGNVLTRTAYATSIPTSTAITQAAVSSAVANIANAGRDSAVRQVWDAANRLSWSVDGVGAVQQFVYDRNGNVVRQVAYATAIGAGAAPASVASAPALDRVVSMAYDNANRMVMRVDALNAVTEQAFDGNGNVVRRTAYANAIASVPALGTAGSAAAIRAALSPNEAIDRTTRYGYDAAGRQVLTVDPLGSATEMQYDGAGHLTATIRFGIPVNTAALAALPSAPTFAALRALVTLGGGADRAWRNAYDAAGRLVYAVDAVGAVTQTQYDGAGRIARTTRYANLVSTATSITAASTAAAIVPSSASDRTEVFSYNAAGLLIASTDALGATETYGYNALGSKTSFTNKKGATWTYDYNAAGRLVTETSPLVAMTTVVTDGAGNLVIDENQTATTGLITRMAYDALGNLVQRTEASGRPEQRSTSYEYDALGRQVRVVFPTVAVYNAAADSLASNGATGVAARTETLQTLETRTYYDTLGNAVASRDVGGALSQKTYDRMGNLVHDVDALGFITGYGRNAFGEMTSLTRYGGATGLGTLGVTNASQAVTKAQVEATLAASSFDHGSDRTQLSTYDKAGRVIQVSGPQGYVYDSTAAGNASFYGSRTTQKTYNAFGEAVEVREFKSGSTWLTTTHYFDKVGRETGVVDAMGYLTTRSYDSVGNLVQVAERANALAAGSWNAAGYGAGPAWSADDRVTGYVFDRNNRKTSEVRLNVEYSNASNGTSVRGDLTTSYGYDAVGNLTRTTDASNQTTFSYYDALGRVTAVAAPARNSTTSGAWLTPLTIFRRDAYGNVVVKQELANGAASATEAGFAPAAGSIADRVTLARYGATGLSSQSADAAGANVLYSYDAYGHLAKKWQGVTGNDGVTRTLFEAYEYDKLGRQTASITPASTAVVQNGGVAIVDQASAGLVVAGAEYNAFGEITRKGTAGGRQEYFDYDLAGNLWRTNSGDGVDRISLYDLQGNVTSEIRSSGSGWVNRDLKAYGNAQQADADYGNRRVDISYDALGHVTQKQEAVRTEFDGGVSTQRSFTSANVVESAVPANGESPGGGQVLPWSGTNRVNLSWSSLGSLGSGDVKVYIEYTTPIQQQLIHDESSNPGYGESGGGTYGSGTYATTGGGVARSYSSGIFNGDVAASGVQLAWQENPSGTDGGVGKITRIVVYKKDVNGQWQEAVNSQPGFAGNDIDVVAPANPNTRITLQLRVAGSPGDSGWWTANLINFGNAYRFDAASLPTGSFQYRVITSAAGEADRITATGVVGLTLPPLASIGVAINFGPAGNGKLAWATPATNVVQELNYRVAGSGAGWSRAVISSSGGYSAADLTALGAANYEYELLWTRADEGVPYAHATGNFVITPPVPRSWVPPVNLPNITNFGVGTMGIGGTYLGNDESGKPMYANQTLVPSLGWAASNSAVAHYRVPGGAWIDLQVDRTGQSTDESGNYIGAEQAQLTMGPGTYEFEILSYSPEAKRATGTFTINSGSSGHYETRTTSVAVYTPIISGYAPVYETRHAVRTVSYGVLVQDPPQPIISGWQPVYETRWGVRTVQYWEQVWDAPIPVYMGTDESGNPYFSHWEYPWHWEARYRDEGYYYQVHVGYEPVYARDENGAVLYNYPAHWETRYRDEWYSYQVQVGQTPIYQLDESGNIAQSVTYTQQTQQVWVNGTAAPPPTFTITTPPYVAGYWKAGTPPQYYSSVTTGPSTQAVSSVNGVTINQGIDANGGDRWVRPVVQQKTDRWGNVVEITDPRSIYWKTTYRYNANNQMVLQTQPVATDRAPVTQVYYDQLGRQVAVRDANGNVNGQVYDQGGNLFQEIHADGGVMSYSYDAFSNRAQMIDALGTRVGFTYDKLGRMLTTVQRPVDVYTTNGANDLVYITNTRLTDSWTYDQAGRKLTQTNGAGETIRYTYDLRGNIIQTTKPLGQTERAAFNAQNRKIGGSDANGALSTWSYDYFGTLVGHTDLGGAGYAYGYDNARQLVAQNNTRGLGTSYAYDAAGQLIRINDANNNKTSLYAYDLGGRRTREVTQQNGITYQDNHLSYDVLGRLREVADGRAHVTMEYDYVGNRTRIVTQVNYQGVGGEAGSVTDRYFRYDAMNRQIVVDGVDAAGNIGTNQGHQLTYDRNGNRTSDTYWGNKVTTAGGEQVISGYNEDGSAIYSNVPVSYVRSDGWTNEQYRYDGMNRLTGVVRDGVQIDSRVYDGAGRVVRSGPAGNLPTGYTAALNQGLAPGQTNGKEARINRYNANGQLMHQKVLDSSNATLQDISWDANETLGVGGISYNADGYDAAGNVRGYVVRNYAGENYASEYTSSLQGFESYQAVSTAGVSTKLRPGTTTQQYDAAGNLIGVTDSVQSANNRRFVNDANGVALYVEQNGNVQRQLVVNGEVLGTYGAGVNQANPSSGANNAPNFANLVDFDFGYAKVSASYPSASPGAYQVRSGDTLQSIAQSAYGDANLWYRIAEANGLASSNDLKVGQTLNIPTKVSTIGNNATTFKPYDPSRITGDTSPTMAMPQAQKGGCGAIGTILVVVVAVVVTAWTAGLLAPAAGAVAGGAGAAGAGAGGLGLGGAMAVAAAGSVASQLVGMAIGVQDSFSWKGVALSAISAGVMQGVPTTLLGGAAGDLGNVMARAAVANAVSQGIGVATGLQKSFNWKSVAASAIGAGVGSRVSQELGITDQQGMVKPGFRALEFGDRLWRASLTGLAAGASTAVARGGRIAVQTIASDAFGNALGASLLDEVRMNDQAGKLEAQQQEILRTYRTAQGINIASSDPSFQPVTHSASDAPSDVRRLEPVTVTARRDSSEETITGVVGTMRGLVGWFGDQGAQATQLLSDQLSGLGNTLTGGYLATQSAGTREAVARNQAMGNGLVNLASQVTGAALRVVTGNMTMADVQSGLNKLSATALRGDAIAALEAKGDYTGAQAERTKARLDVISLGAGGLGALRGLGVAEAAAATGRNVRIGSQLAAEQMASTQVGQAIGTSAENYMVRMGGQYNVVPPSKGGLTVGSSEVQLSATQLRNTSGVATVSSDLSSASGRWLDASVPTPIPAQVGSALAGQSFNTFGDLRQAIWKQIGANSELNSGFSRANLAKMGDGLAPSAPTNWLNETGAFGDSFNIHHANPIEFGGAVYDLSNLQIVSPKVHFDIHYGPK